MKLFILIFLFINSIAYSTEIYSISNGNVIKVTSNSIWIYTPSFINDKKYTFIVEYTNINNITVKFGDIVKEGKKLGTTSVDPHLCCKVIKQ